MNSENQEVMPSPYQRFKDLGGKVFVYAAGGSTIGSWLGGMVGGGIGITVGAILGLVVGWKEDREKYYQDAQ